MKKQMINQVPGQPLTCPKCGSNHIHAGQRGYELMSGFLGAFDLMLHCLQCGTKFRPPHYRKPKANLTLLWVVGILAAAWLAMLAFLNSN